MIVMSRGFVIMPHEKLHVLFGLILMTQYFTSVTTSVSLLSSSSSLSSEASDQAQETRDKASLSSSMSAPSSSSKSMLLSAPSSHHPSSTHLLWPPARTVLRKQHHSSRRLHSHLAIMPYSFHDLIPNSENDLRLSLILDKIDDKPITKISPSSKHQKRHVGCENCTSIRHAGGSDGINSQRKLVRRENAAEVNAVDSHGQLHPMSTRTPTISLSDGAVIEDGTANSSSPYNQGNNNLAISRSDSVGRKNRNRDPVGMCRFRYFMPRELFLLETCGWCYQYMKDDPHIFGIPSKKLNQTLTRVYDHETERNFIVYQLRFNGTKVSNLNFTYPFV